MTLHLPAMRRLIPYGDAAFWETLANDRQYLESLPEEFRFWRHLPADALCMVAFTFRMGGGFPGDVNRTHPFGTEPVENDATSPVLGYGLACVYSATGNTVRQMASGDSTLVNIGGVLVRPFPQQAATSPLAFGGTGTVASPFGTQPAPPVGQPVDILKQGYVAVNVVGTPVKGGAVFVWVGATGSGHTQGGFEAASGASTMAIETDGRTYFNSPPDANGITELAFNI